MSRDSSLPRSPSLRDRESEVSLVHAMKMADSIRQHFQDANSPPSSSLSSSIPPGVLQGASTFVFTGVALLPVRRAILSQSSNSHQAFRNFVDLVISVGHALAATQFGLIAGSLYGGRTYLDDFAKIPPTTESPLADKICHDMRTKILPSHMYRDGKMGFPTREQSSSTWDPRTQTMLSMQEVVQNCQKRLPYKDA